MKKEANEYRGTFSFHYDPDSSHPRHLGDKTRQCPVEIATKERGMLVTITEPDSHAVNQEVERDFVRIVRQLHGRHLSQTPLSDITFQKHDVRDCSGMETISTATFPNGLDGCANFTLDRVIGNYNISGFQFTEDELLLGVGLYHNSREVRLPLTRFPELEKASEEERRLFSMHKHNTVIYWPRLRVKLVARDVILHGLSTQTHPDKLSEQHFLYEIPSPALV